MKYKALMKNGIGPYSNFQWPLPKNGKPGKWVHTKGEIVICENGIHYCESELQLLDWLQEEIYEIEVKGKTIRDDDKSASRSGRLVRKLDTWNERTARLFACDCAEHVLHIFHEKYPDDMRPDEAIETARRYAEGQATEQELEAAYRAAYSAAYRAAYRAWAASWAARDTEKQWQAGRLGSYLRGEI